MRHLHSDLREIAFVDTRQIEWQADSRPGLRFKNLELFGSSSARQTCLMEIDIGSRFMTHSHPYGEEVFFLAGEVIDNFNHYRQGDYSRHPPGAIREIEAIKRTLVFRKIGHLFVFGSHRLHIRHEDQRWNTIPGRPFTVVPLCADNASPTTIVTFPEASSIPATRFRGGSEFIVMQGVLDVFIADRIYRCSEGCWLRLPHGVAAASRSVSGATIFQKTGHLPIL